MASVLTSVRVICAFLVLVFPVFSKWFYILYVTGGVTDVIDGVVARRLRKETNFGAKFDAVADFIFAVAVVAKTAGSMSFPAQLLIWISIIFVIKIANVVTGFVKYGSFIAIHSTMNKICGLIVFILLYSWAESLRGRRRF